MQSWSRSHKTWHDLVSHFTERSMGTLGAKGTEPRRKGVERRRGR